VKRCKECGYIGNRHPKGSNCPMV